jgi:glucosamine--fructose-6-phosphate aminotransferase (isomerizing)
VSAGRLMAAEMAEQPSVLASLAERRPDLVERVRRALPDDLAGVVLIARGSSDQASVYGRYVLEAAARRPVSLAAPSLHTLYRIEADYSGYAAIAVSQSGQTPEIVTVLERLGAAGARSIAITNAAGSPLADAADAVVDLQARDERAVPATKTLTAQLAAFAIVAEAFGAVPWRADDLDGLPEAVEKVLADPEPATAAARAIGDAAGLIAVARGYLYCVALEAALKLKETTSILAEGYSSADFRHGPIAVVDRDVPVLAFAVEGPAAADVHELVDGLRSRGGLVLVAGDHDGADLSLPVGVPEALAPIPAVVRAQQLARALALERGIDPDAPFGLSKVTQTR